VLVLVLVLAVKHRCGGVTNIAWLIFEDALKIKHKVSGSVHRQQENNSAAMQ